jgi:hypothetical protein
MATVDRTWRSPASLAASLALDTDIEASLSGEDLHPDGTVFLPEDLATPGAVESYRRAGSHVAIVSEAGSITLLRPRLTTQQKLLIGLAAALLLWIARSRFLRV